jgi:hypothetical protein
MENIAVTDKRGEGAHFLHLILHQRSVIIELRVAVGERDKET